MKKRTFKIIAIIEFTITFILSCYFRPIYVIPIAWIILSLLALFFSAIATVIFIALSSLYNLLQD